MHQRAFGLLVVLLAALLLIAVYLTYGREARSQLDEEGEMRGSIAAGDSRARRTIDDRQETKPIAEPDSHKTSSSPREVPKSNEIVGDELRDAARALAELGDLKELRARVQELLEDRSAEGREIVLEALAIITDDMKLERMQLVVEELFAHRLSDREFVAEIGGISSRYEVENGNLEGYHGGVNLLGLAVGRLFAEGNLEHAELLKSISERLMSGATSTAEAISFSIALGGCPAGSPEAVRSLTATALQYPRTKIGSTAIVNLGRVGSPDDIIAAVGGIPAAPEAFKDEVAHLDFIAAIGNSLDRHPDEATHVLPYFEEVLTSWDTREDLGTPALQRAAHARKAPGSRSRGDDRGVPPFGAARAGTREGGSGLAEYPSASMRSVANPMIWPRGVEG